MTHIEFIGPPGSGKSTLHAELTSRDNYFGGQKKSIVKRIISTRQRRYRLLYRIASLSRGSDLVNNLIYDRFRHMAFENALEENYNVMEVMWKIANIIEQNKSNTVTYYKKILEKHQLMKATAKKNEEVCLDEGVGMVLAAVLFWSDSMHIQLEDFFQHLPMPKTLVYVQTPTDVCLSRDKRRKNPKLGEPRFKNRVESHRRHREACEKVLDELASKTKIVTVRGIESVDKSINMLIEELSNTCK